MLTRAWRGRLLYDRVGHDNVPASLRPGELPAQHCRGEAPLDTIDSRAVHHRRLHTEGCDVSGVCDGELDPHQTGQVGVVSQSLLQAGLHRIVVVADDTEHHLYGESLPQYSLLCTVQRAAMDRLFDGRWGTC